jgi:hypothetical protein
MSTVSVPLRQHPFSGFSPPLKYFSILPFQRRAASFAGTALFLRSSDLPLLPATKSLIVRQRSPSQGHENFGPGLMPARDGIPIAPRRATVLPEIRRTFAAGGVRPPGLQSGGAADMSIAGSFVNALFRLSSEPAEPKRRLGSGPGRSWARCGFEGRCRKA